MLCAGGSFTKKLPASALCLVLPPRSIGLACLPPACCSVVWGASRLLGSMCPCRAQQAVSPLRWRVARALKSREMLFPLRLHVQKPLEHLWPANVAEECQPKH
jgi:hypothetical protein